MAEDAKISEINKDDLIFPPEDPAQYDAWYREQVEIGLKEADDPNTVMVRNEEVFRAIDERLKQLNDQHIHKKAS